ncbi:type II toxin-antitoxin system Phd/YefM family antitoxin [Flavobacterium eburneipallidum]|uniref:type II toxin-antitoxin system Phd/YefM family antitoxin n=1 Tax=Flavobacterium eburneipallidum TaxID=3003263 RepID=UPI0022AC6E60|nr:type II toxin-antitoxin system Phd/YefM family antitoxin [Flavobacterium eburneipallidum]
MKTVSVTEFRSNIKRYLDIAQEERVVIHRSKGNSFVLVPLDQEKEEDVLNLAQKMAIDKALESVANGKVFSHKEALDKINAKRSDFLK